MNDENTTSNDKKQRNTALKQVHDISTSTQIYDDSYADKSKRRDSLEEKSDDRQKFDVDSISSGVKNDWKATYFLESKGGAQKWQNWACYRYLYRFDLITMYWRNIVSTTTGKEKQYMTNLIRAQEAKEGGW